MKINKYNNICCVGSLYALLLYLTYMSYDDIQQTFFIFDSAINKDVSNRFDNSYRFKKNWLTGNRWLAWIYYKIIIYLKIGKINKNAVVYAQDHLIGIEIFLANKHYILIEDMKFLCHRYYYGNRRSQLLKSRSKILCKVLSFFYGPTYCRHNGDNNNCIAFLLTEKNDDAPYIKGREKIICNMVGQWEKFDIMKKKYIMFVYNITNEDILLYQSKPIIIYSQPLFPDYVKLDEHKRIYKKIISQYSINDILIKAHPRDMYQYEKDFPGIKVFRKNVPSQIFDMIGVKIKKAVTVTSTAVSSICYNVDIDWYGTEISDEYAKKMGHVSPPQNANVIIIDNKK